MLDDTVNLGEGIVIRFTYARLQLSHSVSVDFRKKFLYPTSLIPIISILLLHYFPTSYIRVIFGNLLYYNVIIPYNNTFGSFIKWKISLSDPLFKLLCQSPCGQILILRFVIRAIINPKRACYTSRKAWLTLIPLKTTFMKTPRHLQWEETLDRQNIDFRFPVDLFTSQHN